MSFRNKLKTLRTGQNMTQRQLATRLGVGKSVISYFETGERFPSNDLLVKIADTFHVSTDYLLDLTRERTIDVSGLNEKDIAVVIAVVDALKDKNKS